MRVRDAEAFEGNALRIEHAEHVVIGLDEQLGRVAKAGLRVGEQARRDVTVRADQRQGRHALVQVHGQVGLARVRPEDALLGEEQLIVMRH